MSWAETRGTPRAAARHGSAATSAVALLGLVAIGWGFMAASYRVTAVDAPEVSGPLVPVPNQDTVYGPAVFDIPTGDSAIHVESFNITFQAGTRYTLEVENGDGGVDEVDDALITLNGIERVSNDDPLPSGITEVEMFGMPGSNSLTVELWGPTDSEVTIRILVNGAPWTKIIVDDMLRNGSGPATVDSAEFDLPEFARPPYGLHISTGFSVGNYVVTDGWADINGVEVFGSSDFDAAVLYHEAEISLLDSANLLEIGIVDPDNAQLDAWISSLVFDTIPPVVSFTSPQSGLITSADSVLVQGLATDRWAKQLFFFSGGTYVEHPPLDENDSIFSIMLPLPLTGSNEITANVSDIGWNQDSDTISVTRDPNAPALTVTAPADGLVTIDDSVTVTGSVTDATAVTVTANSVPLPVDGAGQFTGKIALSEGANFVTVVATDEASNNAQVVHVVTVDTADPDLTVTAPTDGSSTAEDSVAVTGSVTDATATTLTLNAMSVTLDSVGGFSTHIMLSTGSNTLAFLATDAAGNTAVDTVTVTQTGGGLPPNPETVASAVPLNVASTIGATTAFLYEGTDPIQTGVTAGAIDSVRAAVLKGRVLDRAGQPMGGVTVSVLGKADFGQTLTRPDGEYDLVVNGGGFENVRFVKSGYPEVQRRVQLPWQDYVVLDDIAMTPLDTAVTVIDFSDPIEVHRATPQTDGDGTRTATLMFKQGTVATIDTGGVVDTLSSISVRATEYTVGADGPEAMPGALPPTSAYTYAVELTVDEAASAGAHRVDFSEPVSFYLDNFLDMPVGIDVPIGYFDREDGEWKAEKDGRVIEVVAIDSLGVASLNIDTISGAESAATVLSELGIDSDELEEIGTIYSAGDELWRGASTHFSPFDHNWAAGLIDFFEENQGRPDDPSSPDDDVVDDCTKCDGSIIGVEGQGIGERIPVVGTPFTLNYSSMRVPGRQASFRLDIPITGDSVSAIIENIELNVSVAGRRWHYEFEPDTSITHTFYWDGMDSYDRLLFGQQPITTAITYSIQSEMFATGGGGGGSSFGSPQGGSINAGFTREDPDITVTWQGRIGARSIDASLGGWTLDVHHSYDPITNRVYMGDGTDRSASHTGNIANTLAGIGSVDFDPDVGEGELAVTAPVSQPSDVAVAPNGEVAIVSNQHGRIRVIDVTDTIRTVTGLGTLDPDGVPADSADLTGPKAIAYGPDGSLWISAFTNSTASIHRIWPDGIIDTYGSLTAVGYAGDGGPANADSVRFKYVEDLTVAPDGSVYFLHGDDTSVNCLGGVCRRVRRIGPNGDLSTIAGTGGEGGGGDGGPAIDATFNRPQSIAMGPDGSIFVGDLDAIRQITPDGHILRFAGASGGVGYTGDGGPAIDARIHVTPRGLTVGSDGSVYFSQDGGAVRMIDPRGVIHTIAGTGVAGYSGDGGRALAAQVRRPWGLAFSPKGDLVIADADDHRVRHIGTSLPGFDGGGHLIASADGSMAYRFGPSGQHVETLSTLTGAVLYSFAYDGLGRLSTVTDGDSLVTTVARNGSGEPTSITGPFGQVTTMTVGTDGYLATVANPASETHSFVMDSLGLIEEFITPTADTTRMVYDADGRLTQHTDPSGRVSTLTRTVSGDSVTVEMTRGSRTSSYLVEQISDGSVGRVVTDPAGHETETTQLRFRDHERDRRRHDAHEHGGTRPEVRRAVARGGVGGARPAVGPDVHVDRRTVGDAVRFDEPTEPGHRARHGRPERPHVQQLFRGRDQDADDDNTVRSGDGQRARQPRATPVARGDRTRQRRVHIQHERTADGGRAGRALVDVRLRRERATAGGHGPAVSYRLAVLRLGGSRHPSGARRRRGDQLRLRRERPLDVAHASRSDRTHVHVQRRRPGLDLRSAGRHGSDGRPDVLHVQHEP